jgi:hypothetical protein
MKVGRVRHSLREVFHLAGISRALGASLPRWQDLKAAISNSYHPERHYMRGPGPKWRQKHAGRMSA